MSKRADNIYMQATTSTSQAGERTHDQSILDVTLETNSEDMHLKRTINAILKLNPCMRATVAEMIRTRGYDAHVGGHHVAILDGKMRLAFFTGNSPDFR